MPGGKSLAFIGNASAQKTMGYEQREVAEAFPMNANDYTLFIKSKTENCLIGAGTVITGIVRKTRGPR